MITDPVALATAAIVVAVAGQWHRPLRRPDRPQPTSDARIGTRSRRPVDHLVRVPFHRPRSN